MASRFAKIRFLVLGTAFCAGASGCLQPSLNPLFDPQAGHFDDRLLGVWVCGEKSETTWTFEKDEGARGNWDFPYYHVVVKTEDASGDLDALIGKLGDYDFVTFAAHDDPRDLPMFVKRHYLGVYTFGRVSIEPNRVRLLMMSSAWAADHRNDMGIALGVFRSKDEFIFTAPSKDLQTFALSHANAKGVFEEAAALVRPGTGTGTCYSEK